jgi:hypothetical protein
MRRRSPHHRPRSPRRETRPQGSPSSSRTPTATSRPAPPWPWTALFRRWTATAGSGFAPCQSPPHGCADRDPRPGNPARCVNAAATSPVTLTCRTPFLPCRVNNAWRSMKLSASRTSLMSEFYLRSGVGVVPYRCELLAGRRSTARIHRWRPSAPRTRQFLPFLHPPIELASFRSHGRLHVEGGLSPQVRDAASPELTDARDGASRKCFLIVGGCFIHARLRRTDRSPPISGSRCREFKSCQPDDFRVGGEALRSTARRRRLASR